MDQTIASWNRLLNWQRSAAVELCAPRRSDHESRQQTRSQHRTLVDYEQSTISLVSRLACFERQP